MSYDPHSIGQAKMTRAHSNCAGHMMTTYYCASKCHDCGWGGCACVSGHCCCQQSDEEEPIVEQKDSKTTKSSTRDSSSKDATYSSKSARNRRAHERRKKRDRMQAAIRDTKEKLEKQK